MPDPADKGRPSSAPLSLEDADRLADSFTPFWEDAPAPAAVTPVPAPSAPVTASTAPPAPVAAFTPPPAPVAAFTPPPAPVAAFTPPPAPVAAAPTPLAAASVAPVSAADPAPDPHPGVVTAPMPVVEAVPNRQPLGKRTLLGIAPITIEKPPPSEPIQSSPNVPGYAIAYTPKDPPSTPAVVIAPEAQSSPEHQPPENKRQFSQTVPSRVRSAPNASALPLPVPLPPLPAVTAGDDFNPYAPKKGKGKVVGLVLSGALLLLVSVVGVRTLSTSAPRAQSSPVLASDVVEAATVGAAAPTLAPAAPPVIAEPSKSPAKSAVPERATAAAAARPTSGPAPAVKVAKVKAKAEAAARPVTRAPTPEPAPTRPASKGVIVRDAPF